MGKNTRKLMKIRLTSENLGMELKFVECMS